MKSSSSSPFLQYSSKYRLLIYLYQILFKIQIRQLLILQVFQLQLLYSANFFLSSVLVIQQRLSPLYNKAGSALSFYQLRTSSLGQQLFSSLNPKYYIQLLLIQLIQDLVQCLSYQRSKYRNTLQSSFSFLYLQ